MDRSQAVLPQNNTAFGQCQTRKQQSESDGMYMVSLGTEKMDASSCARSFSRSEYENCPMLSFHSFGPCVAFCCPIDQAAMERRTAVRDTEERYLAFGSLTIILVTCISSYMGHLSILRAEKDGAKKQNRQMY